MSWICVVDDVADVRDGIAEALRQKGYDVRSFGDGSDALNAIDTAADLPRLVILDVSMPYMTGVEMLGRLRGRQRTAVLPVLLMTGFELDESDISEQDAANVVRKPLALDSLLARVEGLVGPPP
jgi:DNA-binding response OmpR family regulator